MADKLFKTFKNDLYENIFAIGDIHGDIIPLVICLRDCCKVIRKNQIIILNRMKKILI